MENVIAKWLRNTAVAYSYSWFVCRKLDVPAAVPQVW
jgi:hypothetical protein